MKRTTDLQSKQTMHLDHGLLHGLDDTLLDHHARLGCNLESLLGRPFGTNRKTERPFVLLSGLELVRKLSGHILVVLGRHKKLVWIFACN